MPHVKANGQRLFYADQGEGEPLLLIQGLGADHLSWELQREAWAEHFRLISFDNRDVGQSSYTDEGYDIPDLAEDAVALADAIGLDTFHLLGISMGGAIAQEVALAIPERVRTLTLCMSWGGSGLWSAERSRLMANDAMRTPREEHVEKLLLLCLSENMYENHERIAYFRRMALENPHPQKPEGFCRQVQAVGRHEARDRLVNLRVPVHVVGAEHDLMIPVWKSEELSRLIRDAELTVIPEAPHAANMECAEEFNDVVLGWLRRHASEATASSASRPASG